MHCTPLIDQNKTVAILEGGQLRHFTVEELEDKFMEANMDLFISQTSVPSELIHIDQIEPEISREIIIQQLKDDYDQRIQEIFENLQN